MRFHLEPITSEDKELLNVFMHRINQKRIKEFSEKKIIFVLFSKLPMCAATRGFKDTIVML